MTRQLLPHAAVLAAVLVLCTTALAATRTVRVGDNYFIRDRGVPRLSVDRGDRVEWRFVGADPHNVRAIRGPARFKSPTRVRGSFARKMTRSGTYTIICDIHGARDQRMTLVVR